MFRTSHVDRRHGWLQIEYLLDLATVLDFAQWLQTRMQRDLAKRHAINNMATILGLPPDSHILTFRSCTTFGYHHRGAKTDTCEGLKNYDSGIVLTSL